MKKVILGLLAIILIIAAVLTYMGVVPFLSAPFNQPKDLGIRANPQLVYDFEKKYATNNGNGKVILDTHLSSEEITSVFAVWELRDKNFPLKNVQVKFYPDGTGEASGILRLPIAINLAKSLGYSDTDIAKGKQYVQYVAGDLPFYVKGTGGMKNNQISINPATLHIGRVTVPAEIVNPLKSLVIDMIDKRIQQIGGADIKDANFLDGQFHINGTVPSTITY